MLPGRGVLKDGGVLLGGGVLKDGGILPGGGAVGRPCLLQRGQLVAVEEQEVEGRVEK